MAIQWFVSCGLYSARQSDYRVQLRHVNSLVPRPLPPRRGLVHTVHACAKYSIIFSVNWFDWESQWSQVRVWRSCQVLACRLDQTDMGRPYPSMCSITDHVLSYVLPLPCLATPLYISSTSLGGPNWGSFYPNPILTWHMVTPGNFTTPGGQLVSGGWAGATERTASDTERLACCEHSWLLLLS